MDLMPTFLSVAGADYPDVYNGQTIVPLQGKSLMPLLSGDSKIGSEPRDFGWSAYGMDAYRKGDWKVLRLPEPYGNGDWQLYDIATDPGELHDLSAEFPERTKTLADAWEAYAMMNGIVSPNEAIAYSKPVVGRKF